MFNKPVSVSARHTNNANIFTDPKYRQVNFRQREIKIGHLRGNENPDV